MGSEGGSKLSGDEDAIMFSTLYDVKSAAAFKFFECHLGIHGHISMSSVPYL
jgi:hypothetical protein